MAKVTQYETEEGKVPFAEWFSSLGAKAAAKVTVATARMELGNFGDHKSVGGGFGNAASISRRDIVCTMQRMGMS
jgi:putative component of toxin-antitoxin plasmid stabilization module